MIVKAETVIAWQRKGFRLFWTWRIDHGKPGRPKVPQEVRDLIRMLSRNNLSQEDLPAVLPIRAANTSTSLSSPRNLTVPS
jgi:hypothetical protein